MPISEAARTVYFGPFVHCTIFGEIDICESGAIGVDEEGVIAFLDRDVKFEVLDELVKTHGWEDCKVVRIYDSGFFFPGFIGMLISFLQEMDLHLRS
jgi:guanine deaminase